MMCLSIISIVEHLSRICHTIVAFLITLLSQSLFTYYRLLMTIFGEDIHLLLSGLNTRLTYPQSKVLTEI
jgi:hypothetical protein